MVEQSEVGLPDDGLWIDARIEHDHGVHALLGSRPRAHHGDVAHACEAGNDALHVLGEDVQPSGVTIISFFRPLMNRRPCASTSPMSPVWNQPPSNASAVAASRLK